jgi:uncharacterized membrane protein YdjX (TVP38/TMEM64 family)
MSSRANKHRKKPAYSSDEDDGEPDLPAQNSSFDDEDDGSFLPLEEHNNKSSRRKGNRRSQTDDGIDELDSASLLSYCSCKSLRTKISPYMKQIVSIGMLLLIVIILWDATWRPAQDRWIQPQNTIGTMLPWVQEHPLQGMVCLILVIAAAVVVMVPVGTPLTLGCGYIYKGAYGWKLGLSIATFVAIGGSALGAVTCFLLGRYLMRDQVRSWTKSYPLFGAIDVATKENGLKIMAMLYLTPILPLGPVSYMCGTTSMKLRHFVIAKIASLPLMFLYVFIGASMGALIGSDSKGMENELKEIEQNQTLIISGIGMSFVMIAGITHYIKKELNRVRFNSADSRILADMSSACLIRMHSFLIPDT